MLRSCRRKGKCDSECNDTIGTLVDKEVNMQQRSTKHHKPERAANSSEQWKERLRQLGIVHSKQLYNLTVNRGATVELRPDHPSFRECYVNIKIRDTEHFIELFGPGMR